MTLIEQINRDFTAMHVFLDGTKLAVVKDNSTILETDHYLAVIEADTDTVGISPLMTEDEAKAAFNMIKEKLLPHA